MLELFRSPRRAVVWFVEAGLLALLGVSAAGVMVGWGRAFAAGCVLHVILVSLVAQTSMYYHGLYGPRPLRATAVALGHAPRAPRGRRRPRRALPLRAALRGARARRRLRGVRRRGRRAARVARRVRAGRLEPALPPRRADPRRRARGGGVRGSAHRRPGDRARPRRRPDPRGGAAPGGRARARAATPTWRASAPSGASTASWSPPPSGAARSRSGTLLELKLRGIQVEEGLELYERVTGKVFVPALKPSDLVFGRGLSPEAAAAPRQAGLRRGRGRARARPLGAAAPDRGDRHQAGLARARALRAGARRGAGPELHAPQAPIHAHGRGARWAPCGRRRTTRG